MIGSRAPQTISDGYARGQVQPVAGVDALTVGADDRAQRGEERGRDGPGRRARRSRARPRRRRRWAAARRSPGRVRAPIRRARPAAAVAAMNRFAPGSAAARRTGLTSGPEAAAGDEHQALGDLGELVGELHRDAAAERVSDERRAFVAEHDQQVAQAGGERPERVVAAAGRRGAVPGKIGRDHRVVARERLDHLLPVRVCARHPVDQEQHRAAAGGDVGERAAMERHRLRLHRIHVTIVARVSPVRHERRKRAR